MMENEPIIIEIDPKKKYIIQFQQNISMGEYERLKEALAQWLKSDNMPFIMMNGKFEIHRLD